MFDLINKNTNERVTIYKIRDDVNTGYPQFLFYQNDEWIWKSAKHFRPITRDEEMLKYYNEYC